MKIWMALVIFLFLAPVSLAKTKTVMLDRGDSYVMENVNITMIDYNKKKDKIFVCVDNERAIITDGKRVGWVYLEIRSFRDEGVKLTLDADCDDCVVSDNAGCFLAKNSLTIPAEEVNGYGENLSNGEIIIADDNKTDNETSIGKKSVKSGYNGIVKRLMTAIASVFR
ncbi:hypothetical protein HYV89_05605 [Candidatus Woesearchaeota archaeon]|nr:hypothetical protein [Candidatus Woesearchaeota archaeon]